MNITGKTKNCLACRTKATYWLGHVHFVGGSDFILAGFCEEHRWRKLCSETPQLVGYLIGTERQDCQGCFGTMGAVEVLPPIQPFGDLQ